MTGADLAAMRAETDADFAAHALSQVSAACEAVFRARKALRHARRDTALLDACQEALHRQLAALTRELTP